VIVQTSANDAQTHNTALRANAQIFLLLQIARKQKVVHVQITVNAKLLTVEVIRSATTFHCLQATSALITCSVNPTTALEEHASALLSAEPVLFNSPVATTDLAASWVNLLACASMEPPSARTAMPLFLAVTLIPLALTENASLSTLERPEIPAWPRVTVHLQILAFLESVLHLLETATLEHATRCLLIANVLPTTREQPALQTRISVSQSTPNSLPA